MNVTVLYESGDWLAVDKPAGIVVIPARGQPADASLWRALERARGERLWVVHRIDRETSGVVLFARHADAHRAGSLAFEHRDVRKRYRAWTWGTPGATIRTITTPLRPARRGKMQPAAAGDPGGRDAETRVTIERAWRRDHDVLAARLLVEPRTGRQHQIRVHLRSIGTPVIGDRLYGARAAEGPELEWPARLALHACALELPATAGGLRVESPLPEELRALEAALGRIADPDDPGAAR